MDPHFRPESYWTNSNVFAQTQFTCVRLGKNIEADDVRLLRPGLSEAEGSTTNRHQRTGRGESE